MKLLVLLAAFSTIALNAQSSFRIYDAQHNDITGGVLYVSDTDAYDIPAYLYVEKIDSPAFRVTAGRTVISEPAGSQNYLIWGGVMYVPSIDTSVNPPFMAMGDTAEFVGEYLPNGATGPAVINYCFWQSTDMNNSACVTVTFDHTVISGTSAVQNSGAHFTYGPNPAGRQLSISCSNCTLDRVDLYSSRGELVSSSTADSGLKTEFDLSGLPAGIYYIHCSSMEQGTNFSFTFIHTTD